MLDRIKQVYRVLHEVRYFKRIIKTYAQSLFPGRYYLYPSLRAIALNRPESRQRADAYFVKNTQPGKLVQMMSRLNETNYYCNRQDSQLEKYEAVYSANNYDKIREIKLFSFTRKEILTVCTCEEDRQKQLAEYEKLHAYFKMPRLERQNLYAHSYKIAMVELLDRPREQRALKAIADCTGAYHVAHSVEEKTASVRDITALSYEKQACNDLLAKLVEEIAPDLLDMGFPLCFQHGDLSRDNLIYGICEGTEDFWWIDWEHARARLFFYDYFFYILNTAVYFQDTTALRAYLDGDCDGDLQVFFAAFGLTYEPEYRKSYFLLFAIAFLKERVCDRGNMDALNMYCDFINKMVLDKE